GIIEREYEEPIKLDLFLLNPENWGVQSVIRTGPAAFSAALMAFIKNKTPFRVKDGGFLVEEGSEKVISCAEEEDFFKNAGIRFVPLAEREKEPYSVLRLENGEIN